jgi:hypothetical protein
MDPKARQILPPPECPRLQVSRTPQLEGLPPPAHRRSNSYPANPYIPPPGQKRRAFAIPSPPTPLIFKWRCCQPRCDNSPHPDENGVQINVNTSFNTTHTITHFKWVLTCVGCEGNDTYIWQPGFRDEECSKCSHRACSDCMLLHVEGCTEWRGHTDEPAMGRGIWARLGIWDAEESGLALREDDREAPQVFRRQMRRWSRVIRSGSTVME